MAELDIFAPQISVVSHDLGGKSLLIYGPNRVGKTRNLCKLPKPVVLAFESGLNAIDGVPFFRMTEWKLYVQFVKQITDPKNVARAKEMYQTIILDEMSAMGALCEQYICTTFGVQSIGEKKRDASGKVDFTFNGYKELDKENQKWMRRLLASGFTVALIGHEGSRDFKDVNGNEYSKIVPKGDKRIVDAICDAVDIIAYAQPNAPDANGHEVPSSLVIANSPRVLAGSRFDYMPQFLPEFSAENLLSAVNQAITEQEKHEGIHSVSFAEQQETQKVAPSKLTFEEVKKGIETCAHRLTPPGADRPSAKYFAVVEEYLGKNASCQLATEEQMSQLELILEDLQALTL